ncbi:helix-turn-helix domain-containing protein [Paenibacillus cellulosilyticus]|uniref:helix-turn-helix domain-containing protein n=1 Tax=Paenibacillus cellulosilyticus TaxID=375489 RepID=UPI001FEB0387|nr:helix-turn-helix transcriptional regulator [Paenibacillus cellulosilyticus]
MNLGQVIRKIRVEKGLKGNFIANQIGVTPSALSKYESGERKIPSDKLPGLAVALGVPIDLFFDKNIDVTPILTT